MFENLVLPMEEKQLLLALTRSHAKANLKFDDFVVGKGMSRSSLAKYQKLINYCR
jgi:hypothetical protein